MHIVIPRTRTLQLSGGVTVTIRQELNHGQHMAMLARMYQESDDGRLRRKVLEGSDAVTLAYLVDWNLVGPTGDLLDIRGLSVNEMQDVLNNLRQPVVVLIKRAIEAHHETVLEAADDLKKTESSDEQSPTTSLSAAPAA